LMALRSAAAFSTRMRQGISAWHIWEMIISHSVSWCECGACHRRAVPAPVAYTRCEYCHSLLSYSPALTWLF
jgi:hypothetical protein